ncbi:uncharacterized protein LOC142365331 [Opisthocomus hoazin]|uniref:uncharacterized protein LOC142365331 n=1 Tax=Opisthocomus hoazin TaxID=30419 RepID=UPI003F52E2E6
MAALGPAVTSFPCCILMNKKTCCRWGAVVCVLMRRSVRDFSGLCPEPHPTSAWKMLQSAGPSRRERDGVCEPCSCSTRGLHGCRRRRQFSCCAPHIGRFCCVTWRPWQSLRPPFIWGGPISPGHRRSPRRALNFSPPVLPLVRLLVPTLVRSSAQRLRRFQPAARGLARCGPGPVAGQQRGDLNVVLLLLKRNNTDFIFSSRIALRARQPQVPWAAALGLFQAVDWSGCPRLSPGARSRGPATRFSATWGTVLAFPGRVRFIVNIYTLLKMLYMRATLVWKPPGNTTCALQYSWTGTSLSGRALVLLFECFGGSVSHLLWNCRLSQGKNK